LKVWLYRLYLYLYFELMYVWFFSLIFQLPLQMAQAYDYFWTAKILVAAGADKSLKNEDGHCSIDGIDGDMIGVNWIAALTSARSDNELKDALTGIEQDISMDRAKIDKVDLVMGGMGKKRSDKELWTTEIDLWFKELCKSL
jgi:hypothetical protein